MFDISSYVSTAIGDVAAQLQAVIGGGALEVVGLVMGGMAGLGLVLRLVRKAVHSH